MGILNTTPDSFYDGGSYTTLEKALARAGEILEQGAQIIDIGGESTRPGALPLSIAEEIKRTAPVIKAIRKQYSRAAISIDTYNYDTARAALDEGASIINDVSGLRDLRLARLAKTYNAKLVIMHTRGTPQTMNDMCDYQDILAEIYAFFEDKIQQASTCGLTRENLLLDPGLGFAKTKEQNWFLLENLNYFDDLKIPFLIAASRKRFTDKTLELSLKAAALAARANTAIIRAHDVAETAKFLEGLCLR